MTHARRSASASDSSVAAAARCGCTAEVCAEAVGGHGSALLNRSTPGSPGLAGRLPQGDWRGRKATRGGGRSPRITRSPARSARTRSRCAELTRAPGPKTAMRIACPGPARRGFRACAPAVVLVGEQQAGVAQLRHQVAVRAAPGVVGDDHRRQVGHRPARLPEAVAPVDLLRVEEEALIHRPDRLHGLAAGDQEGADEPVGLVLAPVPSGPGLQLLQRAWPASGRRRATRRGCAGGRGSAGSTAAARPRCRAGRRWPGRARDARPSP